MYSKTHFALISLSQTQSANSSATRRYDINQLRKSNQGLLGDFDEPVFQIPETAMIEEFHLRSNTQSRNVSFSQDSGIFLIDVTFGKHSEDKINKHKENILRDLSFMNEQRLQSSNSVCIAEYLPEVKKKLLLIELNGVFIPKIKIPSEKQPQFEEDCKLSFRPHMLKFLREVSQCFTICVFTKFKEQSAMRLVKQIDPHREFISAVLSKQSCQVVGKRLVKNLKIIKNYRRKDIVVIESQLRNVYDHLDNTIPMIPWEADDQYDDELLEIISFLLKLAIQKDVRNHLIKKFQLTKFAIN